MPRLAPNPKTKHKNEASTEVLEIAKTLGSVNTNVDVGLHKSCSLHLTPRPHIERHYVSIFLIRHAQSAFNAVYQRDMPDPMIFDAPITELGASQARQARDAIRHLDIQDIIVSPFTRTLQTAHLIFGENRRFQINAAVREQLCNSCDVGSSPAELASAYPHHSFDHLDECWWHDGDKDHRGISVEPHETLQKRADEFASFLRRERVHSTAIVSHGNFIRALTGIQPQNCEVVEFDPN